jgi:hypothetical protein
VNELHGSRISIEAFLKTYADLFILLGSVYLAMQAVPPVYHRIRRAV